MVIEINNDSDYKLSFEKVDKDNTYIYVPMKFLTSKKGSTNLKNIMIFNDIYFQKHIEDILENYYKYCEKVEYQAPLYCATQPTNEDINNFSHNKSCYFWMIMKPLNQKDIKTFWVAAVTEEGILMFIRVYALIKNENDVISFDLLQQTTYYKSQNKLCSLYR